MSKISRFTFRPARTDLLAWAFVLLYIGYFTWLALLRHASFNSSGFDLGIYDQVTWNSLHGRFLFYTTTGQPLSHLSNHASPIMLLVAPFYLIHSGPETLLFLQAAVIGLGGLPLFWLTREKLHSNLAALTTLTVYLLFPTLQIVTLWDFHPPALAVGFLMIAFYCLEKGYRRWFLLLAILTMACKEQLPLVIVFLGLYSIMRHRDWRLGLLTITLGLTWFFVVMVWVIPTYSVTGNHIFLGYYANFGDSPAKIMLTVITRPDVVLQNLMGVTQWHYLRNILTPFAFLPLLGLPELLIGTPLLTINLLSGNTAMHDASGGQYGADVAPWLAWGTLYGLINLKYIMTRLRSESWLAQYSTQYACILLLVAAFSWQLWHGYSPFALDPPHWEITAHNRLAQRFIDQIPPTASLTAQGKLYPHLSNRLIAYQLPDVHEAEYVFVDVTANTWPIHPSDLKATVQTLLDSGKFGILDAADGYILLQRGLQATSKLPNSFYDFARVTNPTPQYPLTVQFGDDLQLLGFDIMDDPRRQETAVRLYWQALRPINKDLRLYPFFINDKGEIIENTDLRPLLTQLWYPPRHWQTGEYVLSETLPWALGQRWSLAVGVLSGNHWADWSQRLKITRLESTLPRRFEANTWARLATFERQGRNLVEISPTESSPQPTHLLTANFGQQMALVGYDVKQTGQDLTVTLHWQALAPMPVDYTVFVHLLDQNGQRVAQHDNTPWWQLPIPTTTWQANEKLLDQHNLSLPPNLPAGTYHLQVGVYFWQTMQRLTVTQNGTTTDYVELGNVEIRK